MNPKDRMKEALLKASPNTAAFFIITIDDKGNTSVDAHGSLMQINHLCKTAEMFTLKANSGDLRPDVPQEIRQ